MSSIEQKPGRRLWRVRWRVGGRGTTNGSSQWFATRRDAEAFKRALDERRLAVKSTSGRLLIPWNELREKWLATLRGRYHHESRASLKKHTGHWTSTASATPSEMKKIPPGVCRVVRACLRWCYVEHDQRFDERALAFAGKPTRPPRSKKPLLPNEQIDALVRDTTAWSAGSGAIMHFVAHYGHRAESLIRLTDANIQANRLVMTVKGGFIVNHPLLPETLEILRSLKRGPKGELFINHLGVPWESGHTFASWFYHRIGDSKIGYYQVKSAAITAMLDHVDDVTVASITGHRRPSLLKDVYARTNLTRQDAAIAAISASMRRGSPVVHEVQQTLKAANGQTETTEENQEPLTATNSR